MNQFCMCLKVSQLRLNEQKYRNAVFFSFQCQSFTKLSVVSLSFPLFSPSFHTYLRKWKKGNVVIHLIVLWSLCAARSHGDVSLFYVFPSPIHSVICLLLLILSFFSVVGQYRCWWCFFGCVLLMYYYSYYCCSEYYY